MNLHNTGRNITLLLIVIMLPLACADEESTRAAAPSTSITVAEAETRDLSEAFTVSSEVISYKRVYVASRLSGLIDEVHFEEGDYVQKGDIMARLDVRQQQVELKRAVATLNEARDVYERTNTLYEADAATRAELLTARRDLETAESDVELLELFIEYGEIKAPMNAVVTARLIEVGNNVSVNERMFTIADPDLLVIRPGISELNLAGLEEGQPVEIHLDVYPDRTFSGEIRRIFPGVDAATRLFTVEVELIEQEDKPVVRPGYLARVWFAADERRGVISVPSESVVRRNDETYLFVLNDDENRVTQTSVEVGVQRDGFAEILSGIDAGTKVAAANLDALEDGSDVRVAGTFRRHGFRN
jgi:membrane fusion protein, multidrug efflux system